MMAPELFEKTMNATRPPGYEPSWIEMICIFIFLVLITLSLGGCGSEEKCRMVCRPGEKEDCALVCKHKEYWS